MMKRLLPGPYTFILEASRDVPKFMIGKRRTVGIRVPDNRICLEIVQALGRPVLSTSVAPSGIAASANGNDMNDADSIAARYGKVVDVIVDGGGHCPGTVDGGRSDRRGARDPSGERG